MLEELPSAPSLFQEGSQLKLWPLPLPVWSYVLPLRGSVLRSYDSTPRTRIGGKRAQQAAVDSPSLRMRDGRLPTFRLPTAATFACPEMCSRRRLAMDSFTSKSSDIEASPL